MKILKVLKYAVREKRLRDDYYRIHPNTSSRVKAVTFWQLIKIGWKYHGT